MVRKLIKNGSSLFATRQQTILGAAFILASMVALSRILGLVRTRLLAQYFPPAEIAVYFAAFRVPDFLYNVFVYGALSVAFIPVFSSLLSKKGPKDAFSFSSNLLTLGVIFYTILSVIVFIFAEPIIRLVVIGFEGNEFAETVMLTRALLFAQLFFVVGGTFSSILQVHRFFLIPAVAGVLYNLGIIFGILMFASTHGIWAPVYGVYIGAALFMVTHIPLLRQTGFTYTPLLSLRDKGFLQVLTLMLPRTLATLAEQLRMTFNVSLASIISIRSVTFFSISHQLFLVPIGLFASSVAQAALPVFSEEYSKGDMKSFARTLMVSLQQMLFFILPSAAILIVLKIPVVRLVFGADQFNWEATVITSLTVAWLSVGLAFEASNMLFIRAFYALHDTFTPVKVIITALVIDALSALLFIMVFKWDVWSLGIATTIGGGITSVFLYGLLAKRVPGLVSKDFFVPIIKMTICALAMAISLYVPIKALDQVVVNTNRTIGLIVLTGIAGSCGMGMYLFFTWILKVKEAFMIIEYTQKLFDRGKKIASEVSVQSS